MINELHAGFWRDNGWLRAGIGLIVSQVASFLAITRTEAFEVHINGGTSVNAAIAEGVLISNSERVELFISIGRVWLPAIARKIITTIIKTERSTRHHTIDILANNQGIVGPGAEEIFRSINITAEFCVNNFLRHEGINCAISINWAVPNLYRWLFRNSAASSTRNIPIASSIHCAFTVSVLHFETIIWAWTINIIMGIGREDADCNTVLIAHPLVVIRNNGRHLFRGFLTIIETIRILVASFDSFRICDDGAFFLKESGWIVFSELVTFNFFIIWMIKEFYHLNLSIRWSNSSIFKIWKFVVFARLHLPSEFIFGVCALE